MVASTRVQMLGNKSDEILVLIEFLKNPKLADQLAEEVVKLNMLTDEQEKQLQEAKLLIQSHATALKSYEELKKTMSDEYDAHIAKMEAERKDFDAQLDSEANAMDAEKTLLSEAQAANEAEIVRLKQWDNKLKETAAKIQGLAGA